MCFLKNYERVQEIQQQIVWKSVVELEPRSFIPSVRVNRALHNKSAENDDVQNDTAWYDDSYVQKW